MTYAATFTRTKTIVAPAAGTTGGVVRVVYTVTAVEDFPDTGLFVFLRDRSNFRINFNHVAQPSELVSLTLNTISSAGWTRKSSVTLDFLTDSLASAAISDIDAALFQLIDDMNSSAVLAAETVSYPSVPVVSGTTVTLFGSPFTIFGQQITFQGTPSTGGTTVTLFGSPFTTFGQTITFP